MLRFFHSLRRKLIEQDNMRKYVWYAIGEILLVMIGILLALQVNNWNEQNKKKAEAHLYHEYLLDDINLMIDDIDGTKQYADANFSAIKTSLNALNKGYLEVPEDSVFEVFLYRYYKFTISLQDLNTYKEMQSAGDLELIRNVHLRDELTDLLDRKDFFIEVHRTFHSNTHLTSDYLDPYLQYSFTSDTLNTNPVIKYNFNAMANDSVLIRKVSRQAMLWQESISFHDSYQRRLGDVKALLIEEIERLN